MRRLVPILIAVVALEGFAFAPSSASGCTPRMLVLAAMPTEIDPLLSRAKLDTSRTVTLDGRSFYIGRLRGNDVVLALSGIGLVNADHATKLALDHFRCGSKPGINRIMFSGVSGGRTSIGDVTIPRRWTLNAGKTWYGVDPAMLAVAKRASGAAQLSQDTPLGDCACVGVDPDLIRTVHMDHVPQIIAGGNGTSADGFGGRAFPCVPGGGDVFGCEACRAPNRAPPDLARFVTGAVPFLDPDFFTGYFEQPATPAGVDAVDMETAAVARVAARNKIPFIAFRALSDGLDDPLMLPGFPAQFFVYRQLAADNAAAVALAFLDAWAKVAS